MNDLDNKQILRLKNQIKSLEIELQSESNNSQNATERENIINDLKNKIEETENELKNMNDDIIKLNKENKAKNNKNNQQEIQKEGGLLLIISAMRTHVKSPRLQSSAADALIYSTSIVNKGWCMLEEEIDDFPNLLKDLSNNTFLSHTSRTKLDVLHQSYTKNKLR